MDIAKYIGLFLLKNKYVCLQGLGNLEIIKTGAKQNGDEISGPAYYCKLNPVGSLDDAFPNFVATNEQVSIAKASNEISSFVKEAKATLAEGKSVIIPSVGEYQMRNHQIHFELNPAFSAPEKNIHFPKAIRPEQATNPTATDTHSDLSHSGNYNNYNQSRNVNWNLVAFWAIIIIIGGSIIFWGVRYFLSQQDQDYTDISTGEHKRPSDTATAAYYVVDSNSIPRTDSLNNTNTPTPSSDTPELKFVVQQYSNLGKATARSNKLNSYGYTTSVVSQDSTTHLVVQVMKTMWADTSRTKDSLAKLLNPSGVSILK